MSTAAGDRRWPQAILFALVLECILGCLAAPAVLAADRVALVIGNGAYSENALTNPPNDARDMKRVLEEIGFQVILAVDADLEEMETRVDEFARQLGPSSVGFFYYAGHGVQAGGWNYLVPIGGMKAITTQKKLRYKAMNAQSVIDAMEGAGNLLNVVVLDACRNNPFRGSWRSGAQRGLAPMRQASGMLIAYSTALGDVAADGEGRNSPFTKSLLKELKVPGQRVQRVFEKVIASVHGATGGRQVPWLAHSIIGDFYFVEGEAPRERIAPPRKSPVPATVTLKVRSNVSRDEVTIDGVPRGSTPVRADLRVGRHLVRVEKAGYGPWEQWLDLQGPRTVRVQLKRGRAPQSEPERSEPSSVTRPPPSRPGASARARGLTALGTNVQGYEEYRNEKDGSVLIRVPAGPFTMGSEHGHSNERPVRRVTLSEYLIGKHEITNAQYARFLAAAKDPSGPTRHGGHHPDEGKGKDHTPIGGQGVKWAPYSTRDGTPVIGIDWYDAYAYCAWAGLRLATDAEWEKAARGTDGREYPWGNEAPGGAGRPFANYADRSVKKAKIDGLTWADEEHDDGYTYTAPVTAFPEGASPLGALNMSGNVWEWCADWYEDSYYNHGPDHDPKGPDHGSNRVLRGGSWVNNARPLRAADRGYVAPSSRGVISGFRPARSFP